MFLLALDRFFVVWRWIPSGRFISESIQYIPRDSSYQSAQNFSLKLPRQTQDQDRHCEQQHGIYFNKNPGTEYCFDLRGQTIACRSCLQKNWKTNQHYNGDAKERQTQPDCEIIDLCVWFIQFRQDSRFPRP